jgi:NRPS condensation-like uncharacterized protein
MNRALRRLEARHEALRTRIRVIAGQPSRIISESLDVDLELVDFASRPPEVQQAEMAAFVDRMWSKTFDHERGPELRAAVIRFRNDEHVLLLCTNHVVIGGASRQVVLREVMPAYAGEVGKPWRPEELAVQMADYAVWQRSHVRSEDMQDRLLSGRRAIEGAEPLELPRARPYPSERTLDVFSQSVEIPARLWDAIGALVIPERATVSIALLAALKALLHRRSGQSDLIVGLPISTSDQHPELKHIAGNFVDHVLVRTNLSHNLTFRDLLRRVRAGTLDAISSAVPLQLLLESVSPLDHPFMRLVFNHQTAVMNAQEAPQPAGELNAKLLRVEFGNTRKFDMIVGPFTRGLWVTAASDIFDRSTIVALLADYVLLLESVARSPDQPIAQLPISC